MRSVAAGIALVAMGALLTGCAAGDAPETVVVTSTQFVEAEQELIDEAQPEPQPEPEQANAQAGFALDPAYADQVGGDCGYTPDGDRIRVGDNTSCAFAAVVYPLAMNAEWMMTQNPNVTSIPKTFLPGVKSPVTGDAYDLTCYVGSDSANLRCSEDDGDPQVDFTNESNRLGGRINIVG